MAASVTKTCLIKDTRPDGFLITLLRGTPGSKEARARFKSDFEGPYPEEWHIHDIKVTATYTEAVIEFKLSAEIDWNFVLKYLNSGLASTWLVKLEEAIE